MNFAPHDYQAYAIDYIETHPVAAVLLDMGLGKTVISLTAIADLLFDSFEAHRIQKAQSKEAYDEIADEIFRLRELRQQTTVDTAARDDQIKRINDLQDYIAQQTTYLTEFDESLVRRWIKEITIWDDHITVELKSGVSIDVDA